MKEDIPSASSMQNYDYENDQHVFAIDSLVHELGIPAEEVNRSYREILEEFKNDISVRAFLPTLVSMGVKERLASSC
ncbi:MAG: hypothetical protein M0Z89_02355 [Nitrospiraceae bacterium]|nr:hypothetical protein [Nitrospiraceae bacterium]